jgi:hypothetical protein
MPIAMRALKTFSGRAGESRRKEFLVEDGDDIMVATQGRADHLEKHGLAVPLIKPRAKVESAPQNKMEPPSQNKAAQSGPLPSPGGETGVENAPSSSDLDRAPRVRRSRKPADGLDL